MPDQIFYVGAENPKNKNLTGYVPAKFLNINGSPVVDPLSGGSQDSYIYADPSGKYKVRGAVANPNNYLIVPANYTEQGARAFAGQIARIKDQAGIGPAAWQMYDAFGQRGPQDLQRNPQWGIPKDSFVPAFVSSASYHLGLVTRHAEMPRAVSEGAGGLANRLNRVSNSSIDTSGDYWGLSKKNYANFSKGFSDADAASNGEPLTNFTYGTQTQGPPDQIGDGNGLGVGDWRFPFANVDLAKYTALPQVADPSIRYVSRRSSNGSKLSAFDAGVSAAPFAPSAGAVPQDSFNDRFGNWLSSSDGTAATGRPPLPQAGRLIGISSGQPMPQWITPPPIWGLR